MRHEQLFQPTVAAAVGGALGWWLGPMIFLYLGVHLLGIWYSVASGNVLRLLFWIFLLWGLVGFPGASRLWHRDVSRTAYRQDWFEAKVSGTPVILPVEEAPRPDLPGYARRPFGRWVGAAFLAGIGTGAAVKLAVVS